MYLSHFSEKNIWYKASGFNGLFNTKAHGAITLSKLLNRVSTSCPYYLSGSNQQDLDPTSHYITFVIVP